MSNSQRGFPFDTNVTLDYNVSITCGAEIQSVSESKVQFVYFLNETANAEAIIELNSDAVRNEFGDYNYYNFNT